MNSRDQQIIRKVLAEIEVANSFVEGMAYSEFAADERTRRAACMTLINK